MQNPTNRRFLDNATDVYIGGGSEAIFLSVAFVENTRYAFTPAGAFVSKSPSIGVAGRVGPPGGLGFKRPGPNLHPSVANSALCHSFRANRNGLRRYAYRRAAALGGAVRIKPVAESIALAPPSVRKDRWEATRANRAPRRIRRIKCALPCPDE